MNRRSTLVASVQGGVGHANPLAELERPMTLAKCFLASSNLLLVVVIQAGAHQTDSEPQATKSPTLTRATVTSKKVTFAFPVDGKTTWNWYLKKTPVNALEYQWMVRIERKQSAYEFGYLLFKSPGAQEQSGQLQDLLKCRAG